MKVKVRHEFTGSMRFRLTFTLPRIGHCVEYIRAETWTRTQSVEALDMLQYVYGISRQNVRFIHQ
jgi:hypothetical protein